MCCGDSGEVSRSLQKHFVCSKFKVSLSLFLVPSSSSQQKWVLKIWSPLSLSHCLSTFTFICFLLRQVFLPQIVKREKQIWKINFHHLRQILMVKSNICLPTYLWIRLRLPFCHPRFESQEHHIRIVCNFKFIKECSKVITYIGRVVAWSCILYCIILSRYTYTKSSSKYCLFLIGQRLNLAKGSD